MFQRLTMQEVVDILKTTPEQCAFDWKRDFTLPTSDEQRGELIKDIAAIANSLTNYPGFIFYGVDGDAKEPIIGITQSYDDARIQQLIQGKISPEPQFLYYEILVENARIGVIHVLPTQNRPFIIQCNMGKIRAGQILVRKGSSTKPVDISDLYSMFYGEHSRHYKAQLSFVNQRIQQEQLRLQYFAQLQTAIDRNDRDVDRMLGL